jgi:hypothetical protein
MRWMLAAGAVVFGWVGAGASGAQTAILEVAPPPPGPSMARVAAARPMLMVGPGNGVEGEPYSVLLTTTTVQTLADGTTVTRFVREQRFVRDAQGRTRDETIMSVAGVKQTLNVNIMDPIARGAIMLMPSTKEARVMHFVEPKPLTEEEKAQQAEARGKRLAARAARAASGVKTPRADTPQPEALPERTIDGLAAEGERTVRVIAVGEIGNDRELRVVTDTWVSQELRIILEQTVDDPVYGKSTMVASELERSAPDPVMFQVPEGYKVIDVTPAATTP